MAPRKKKAKKVEGDGIEDVIANLNKKYGEKTVFRLDSDFALPVDAISTGSLDLDIALGVGGLPKGRIVEIYGMEGYGKTSLALSTMAQAQQWGSWVGFVDMEHAIDPAWVETNGVNMKKAYLTQPDGGEEALEIALALVKSGEFGVVVIDSVAALLPKMEEEGEVGKSHMGLQARLMGQALRKMMPFVGKTNTLVIFTNQVRQKIGGFGDPTVTPGGMALKFWSSVRISIRKGYKAYTKKNKVAAPFKEGVFTIHDNYGVDSVDCAAKAGLDLEVIEQSGSWYSFKDVKKQGWPQFVEEIRVTDGVFNQIQDEIRGVLGWETQPSVVLVGKNASTKLGGKIMDMQDESMSFEGVKKETGLEMLGDYTLPETQKVVYKRNEWDSPAELAALMKDAGTFEVSGTWVKAFGHSYQGWSKFIEAMENSPQLYTEGEDTYLKSMGLVQDTGKNE